MYSLIFIVTLSVTCLWSVDVFAKQSLSGQEALTEALMKHQGEVIYLDFWASWCGPCRKSFPWMNEMQTTYQGKGFTVISINLDAEYDLASIFLKETPAQFPVIYDPKGETAKKYKVKGMPTSYLIGKDGQIKVAHTGFFMNKIDQYEAEIIQLLATNSFENGTTHE